MKALLKKLKTTDCSKVGISKYYDFTQLAHLEEVRDQQAYSPLFQDDIILECNSDNAVLHAFQELLLETYSASKLQYLNIRKMDKAIDSEGMERDIEHINSILKTCKTKSDLYPYFEIRDLSTANWFRD